METSLFTGSLSNQILKVCRVSFQMKIPIGQTNWAIEKPIQETLYKFNELGFELWVKAQMFQVKRQVQVLWRLSKWTVWSFLGVWCHQSWWKFINRTLNQWSKNCIFKGNVSQNLAKTSDYNYKTIYNTLIKIAHKQITNE